MREPLRSSRRPGPRRRTPNERVQGPQWWTAYQPVSYGIATRPGDRTAFKRMIDTCHAAGVEVVVDTVINHLADSAGTGTGDSPWREIAGMVGFRNTAGGAAVTHWWDNGGNAVAFGRGGKAYA